MGVVGEERDGEQRERDKEKDGHQRCAAEMPSQNEGEGIEQRKG